MATKLTGTPKAEADLPEADAVDDGDDGDYDAESDPAPEPVAAPVVAKDPMIRRKIEDKLERIRLREELGIYDEDQWKDL